MATAVVITNPSFDAYLAAENARRTAESPLLITYYTQENAWRLANNIRETTRDAAAVTELALQVAQLGTFYNRADSAITDRDAKIDAQIAFMQTLEDYKLNQDLPIIQLKGTVLTDLDLPELIPCGSGFTMHLPSFNDGFAVDEKATQIGREVCGGVPTDWSLHAGRLSGYRTASYVSGIVSNADRRRLERFRKRKTDLVRQAQIGIKSSYSANETLSKYAQATAIHSGLADLYIQGFNSAGAGLGVTLGKLAASGENETTATAPTTGAASGTSQSGDLGAPF